MKYYVLETITDGETVKFNKKFTSRNQAISYAFNYLEKLTYNDTLQVEDIFKIEGNKHNIEYVLDYYNRFRVHRVELQLNH